MDHLQNIDENKTSKRVEIMYKCYLEVEEFMGHKNFELVMGYKECDYKRKSELPYSKLISDFEALEDKMYAMAAVEDLFLLDEVKKLELYLTSFPEVIFRYEPADLPIKGDMLPFDWKYTSGVVNLRDFTKSDHNNQLDFDVCCYYNTEHV